MTANSENEVKTPIRNSTDDEDITFFFFYDIVKQLILKRNDIGGQANTVLDASVLSSWLKSLEENKNKSVRNEYIKLMTLSLQYPDPICPFKVPPPETIDPLEDGVLEMSRRFLKKEGTATCVGDAENPTKTSYPTINTAMSNDKCQYASYQVIPNVGVQCYYAFSDEPMYNWTVNSNIITIPKGGPHATDIEWERALAGVIYKLHKPNTENVPPPKATAKDDENDAKSFSSGSRVSGKKIDKSKIKEELPEICKVMNIEQQNRNVTEVFEWNDASLLTGDIRLGAEMCSDRKVVTQVKTQIEIDREVFNAYDKLYPGEFMISVEPSVINDIVPTNTNVVTEACDKKPIREEAQQPSAQDGGGGCAGPRPKPRQCPRPKLCTMRQSAGHGNVRPPIEERQADDEKSQTDHWRQRIASLTDNLATLKATDSRISNYGNCQTFGDQPPPPPRRPTPANDYSFTASGRRGRRGDDGGVSGSGVKPAWSVESRAGRHLDDGLPFKREAGPRSVIDYTSECFEEMKNVLRSSRSGRTESKCTAGLYERANSRSNESDEPQSDV